ncbi:MAG TPA: thiamine phosphate synthase [Dehalococcoidia bacterium]
MPGLPRPCLALVTDRTLAPDLPAAVERAVRGGVDLVQLRERDLPAGDLLRLARELRAITRGRALLVVNDRLDVALAAGADGVHLPEAGLPVPAARRLAPDGFLVGRSVHDAEGAARAAREGADYLVVGTVFPSRSHPGGGAAGPGLLGRVRAAAGPLPLLGIGGIDAGNAAAVLAAGADGVAVVSAVLAAADPEAAARALRAALTAG